MCVLSQLELGINIARVSLFSITNRGYCNSRQLLHVQHLRGGLCNLGNRLGASFKQREVKKLRGEMGWTLGYGKSHATAA